MLAIWKDLGPREKSNFFKLTGGIIVILALMFGFVALLISHDDVAAAMPPGVVTLYSNTGQVIQTWKAQARTVGSGHGFLYFRDERGTYHQVSGVVVYSGPR